MTEGTPIACSLGASDLRQRLEEIAEVGADGLIESGGAGDRHLLRFRSDARTRARLEAILAAEARCCSFLDLSLEERGGQLVLTVGAPADGRVIAGALAAAFAGSGHKVSPVIDADTEKRLAAEAAAKLVEDGMTVGLGTGSTVAHLLPAIARRGVSGIRCVATSVATEEQARELGIPVEDFSSLQRLDIAIDGTDEVTPDGWLIKGGGGAHLREKIVAAAAARFVVIADSSKPVDALRGPVPLELFAFGVASTLARLGAEVEPRDVPPSPDGGTIADYRGAIDDPAELAARLEADPGVAAHGLFPPALVHDLFIARGDEVEHIRLSG